MLQVQQITSDPLQTQALALPDGSILRLTLYFMPMQQCWVIRQLTYGSFVLNNIKISNNPNILHQFKNKIPFGLACFSAGNREPSLQEDFSSGASSLYILTADEVKQYAGFLSGQVPA